MARPTPAAAARASAARAVAEHLRGVRLGVVLRVVAEGAPRPEVPPAAGVGRDAVEDGEAGGRCGEGRLEHPHGVVVGEPRGELATAGRRGQEGADAGAQGVEPVPVGVQVHQALGGHLGDAVEGVGPAADVRAEHVGDVSARGAADGVVAGGVDEPAYAVTHHRLEERTRRDDVGPEGVGQRRLGRDLGDGRVDGDRVGAVEHEVGATAREVGADDLVTERGQARREHAADGAGSAGEKDLQESSPSFEA